LRGPVALVCALLAGLIIVSACSSFEGSETAEADAEAAAESSTPDDAGVCMPPSCGGPSGRCGNVSACGLEFSCGECAPPFACVGGSCTCTGGADVCNAQGASCGEVDNGCGSATSCGSCSGVDSCQTKDGGLACAPGPCIDDPTAKTCLGRCRQGTNNCGKVITCGSCPNAELCGAQGNVNQCGCPARPLPLNQFYDGAGHFCYTQQASCPANFGFTGAVARLYSGVTEGLVPLYRCRKGFSFMLSTFTSCEGVPGYVLEGPVGACATAPSCGAALLRRYYNPTTMDFVHGLGTVAPPGYSAFGTPCYAWAP
jgi:hypothetical protein